MRCGAGSGAGAAEPEGSGRTHPEQRRNSERCSRESKAAIPAGGRGKSARRDPGRYLLWVARLPETCQVLAHEFREYAGTALFWDSSGRTRHYRSDGAQQRKKRRLCADYLLSGAQPGKTDADIRLVLQQLLTMRGSSPRQGGHDLETAEWIAEIWQHRGAPFDQEPCSCAGTNTKEMQPKGLRCLQVP